MNILGFFQRLGRALQLPIAVLPVAALLLRFGQPDLLNVAFIAQAGGAIFDNLALIFAIGVASSWSKDSAGAAALAGAVGYFVLTKAMVTINPEINMGVLAGIITGLVGGAAYNRWSDIKLPDFLSAGDGTAGMFMSGFFPIMMFGLPGAALAMYFAAPKERRPMVGGMLLSVAVTAFLTGVTEPLEFLFMFLAPLLYLLHALLTGISLFVATLLGIHAGFSFSAGAIDYALMYNLPAASQNVWMLLVMGVVFFAIYFVVFSLVIRMFNLKTPGREDKEDEIVTEEANSNTEEGLNQLATNYIAAVGGTDNLKAIDACITRLRLTVADSARVNDTMCKRLGASGVVKLNKQTIQVIVGAKAESIGDAMKKVVARGPVAAASAEATPATAAPVAKPQAVPNAVSVAELVSPITGDVVALDQVPDEAFASKAVGDGVAVKPTDKIVVSPAAGTIVKIFNTNHAFCLETEKGAEIVVHMGIDTVALEGKGFKRLVEEGAQVSAGQPILEMDLDYLNENARSMISPVVCSNIDDFSGLIIKAQGHVVAGQTPLYEIKK
ncbi:PTS N-acetyl glucosamine transporter subunit IIABC [Escherichia coli]|nr:PTS N-acetyl glucosamine transporter subunit IIABC [Escherichia coli]